MEVQTPVTALTRTLETFLSDQKQKNKAPKVPVRYAEAQGFLRLTKFVSPGYSQEDTYHAFCERDFPGLATAFRNHTRVRIVESWWQELIGREALFFWTTDWVKKQHSSKAFLFLDTGEKLELEDMPLGTVICLPDHILPIPVSPPLTKTPT